MAKVLTGYVKKPDGSAWPNALCGLALVQVGTQTNAVYPNTSDHRNRTILLTDANGKIADTTLETPSSGAWTYRLYLPDGSYHDAPISGSGTITVEEFILLAGTVTPVQGTPEWDWLGVLYDEAQTAVTGNVATWDSNQIIDSGEALASFLKNTTDIFTGILTLAGAATIISEDGSSTFLEMLNSRLRLSHSASGVSYTISLSADGGIILNTSNFGAGASCKIVIKEDSVLIQDVGSGAQILVDSDGITTTAQTADSIDITNNLTVGGTAEVTGDLTVGGQAIIQQGSAASPSVASSAGGHTGVNFNGAKVQLVSAGVVVAEFNNITSPAIGRELDLYGGKIVNYGEYVGNASISAGAITFFVTTNNVFLVNHNQNITSISITWPDDIEACSFEVIYTQDTTGGRTINHAGFYGPNNAAPAISTTANAENSIIYSTKDGGATVRAELRGKNYGVIS